jgi:hypothetical protein
MEAIGCEFICIPNRNFAGGDCFWYCPGIPPYLAHIGRPPGCAGEAVKV